ncbi:unnamed protein product, partial [Lactuca virosa]
MYHSQSAIKPILIVSTKDAVISSLPPKMLSRSGNRYLNPSCWPSRHSCPQVSAGTSLAMNPQAVSSLAPL